MVTPSRRPPSKNFDEYVRSLPGRCQGCGFHIATQGCACAGGRLKFEQQANAGDEWGIFVAALREAVRDGEVHQRDMRPLIRGRIEPKHIGLFYRRAKRDGLLIEVRREQSNDEQGGNTNKWEPIYELRAAA
jgi:hypothetical protein